MLFLCYLSKMDNLYNILLTELPKIAAVVEGFPEGQRDKVLDLLIDALKNSGTIPDVQSLPIAPAVKPKEFTTVTTNHPVKKKADTTESETSKKLSRLRAKIFEQTTSGAIENNEEQDAIKAGLDEMTVEELSNVIFYQKGRSTPLTDLM